MATTIELNVTGMTCDHCVNAVTGAIEGVPGVQKANVDLDAKLARVDVANADVQAIIAAIEEEGYEAAVR